MLPSRPSCSCLDPLPPLSRLTPNHAAPRPGAIRSPALPDSALGASAPSSESDGTRQVPGNRSALTHLAHAVPSCTGPKPKHLCTPRPLGWRPPCALCCSVPCTRSVGACSAVCQVALIGDSPASPLGAPGVHALTSLWPSYSVG